jgi:hypothetical protein
MNDNSVAAVIPTYNRAAILRRSIESALRQSHPVKEIIVVDDGSTDQTAQVVSQYSSRIHYVVQRNAGGAAARNRGVAMAQSKWIAFLDSDDEWLPHKTEMQLAALESCRLSFAADHIGFITWTDPGSWSRHGFLCSLQSVCEICSPPQSQWCRGACSSSTTVFARTFGPAARTGSCFAGWPRIALAQLRLARSSIITCHNRASATIRGS